MTDDDLRSRKIADYKQKLENQAARIASEPPEKVEVKADRRDETPLQKREREREERKKKLADETAAEEAALKAKLEARKAEREARAAQEKLEDDARLAEIEKRRIARRAALGEDTSVSTTPKVGDAGVVNSKIDEREKAAVVVKDESTGTTQVNLRTVLHGAKKSDLAAPVKAMTTAEAFDPTSGEKIVRQTHDETDAPAVDTSKPAVGDTFKVALKSAPKGPAKRGVKTVDAAAATESLASLLK